MLKPKWELDFFLICFPLLFYLKLMVLVFLLGKVFPPVALFLYYNIFSFYSIAKVKIYGDNINKSIIVVYLMIRIL